MRVSDTRVRVPSTGKPEFVMTGITRPGGGVRLYASRDLRAMDWGQMDLPDQTTAWHLETGMVHVLIIDAPTWGEAFARAWQIWASADRDKAVSEHEKAGNITGGEARQLRRGRMLDGPAHGREPLWKRRSASRLTRTSRTPAWPPART